MKQGRRAQQFILHHLMDTCHLKNDELVAKHQKYKGRVAIRGDIVKDDSGSYAVFTEQGSSAMTAAKIMDHLQIARLRSGYTQVKMGKVHTFGFVYRSTNGRNHGPVWKTQSFLLNEIYMVILWQDSNGKGNLRRSC